jgi:hypothetical protein
MLLARDVAASVLTPARARRVVGALARIDLAVDMIDDVQDGVAGVERLARAHQRLADGLSALDPAALSEVARGLAHMAKGQVADLAGVPSRRASPHQRRAAHGVARRKAGAAAGAYVAAVLASAGRRSARAVACAAAFGELVQQLSDLSSLLANRDPEDWRLRRPSFAIVGPIHARATAELARRLVHEHPRATALDGFREVVARSGALRTFRRRLDAFVRRAVTSADTSPLNAAMLPQIRALHARARRLDDDLGLAPTRRIRLRALSDRRDEAVEAALEYLHSPGTIDECDEHHRWGLFSRGCVRGDVFGRLLVIEALGGLAACGRLPFAQWLEGVAARVDPDGLRYFPGCPEIPPDADDAALFLLACRVLGMAGRSAASAAITRAQRRARATLTRCARADGWYETWDLSRHGTAVARWRWDATLCPTVAAHASLALRVTPRASQLARMAAVRSPHYTDFVARCIHSRLRGAARSRALALVRAPSDAVEIGLALRDLALRPAYRRDLVMLLLEAQREDGGFAAAPIYRTIGREGVRWYQSRAVATAIAVRGLMTAPVDAAALDLRGRGPAGSAAAGM